MKSCLLNIRRKRIKIVKSLMTQIMKQKRVDLHKDNSTNTSLSQGKILVTLTNSLLLITMEPSFQPSPSTPFAALPGFRSTTKTARAISMTVDTETWINMMGVQGAMNTAWVMLFFATQTRHCKVAGFWITYASPDTSSSLPKAVA